MSNQTCNHVWRGSVEDILQCISCGQKSSEIYWFRVYVVDFPEEEVKDFTVTNSVYVYTEDVDNLVKYNYNFR